MKLWFEGWNVNAHAASPLQRLHAAALAVAQQRDKILLRRKDGGETVPPNNFP
jgi:hypothetical protein